MPRLSYTFETRCVGELLEDETTQIPDHQRPEMWQPKRQEALIETIMSGRPMPNLTFRSEIHDNQMTNWLEDGQQRYISMKKFSENRLAWKGKFYRDLSSDEIVSFRSYKLSILNYKNATMEETIQIFDDFQNGVALTPGQRFHARMATPLVKYARDRFLKPGQHFHTRMKEVFGPHDHTKDTKTKKNLMNVMALAGGLAFGVEFITTSYDILGPKLHQPFDEAKADALMNHILEVYEEVERAHHITTKQKNKYWPVGHTTGYILASFLEHPDDIENLKLLWANYLVDVRENTQPIALLHHNMPASRNWNAERWRVGYNNIMNPPDDFDFDTPSSDAWSDSDNDE